MVLVTTVGHSCWRYDLSQKGDLHMTSPWIQKMWKLWSLGKRWSRTMWNLTLSSSEICSESSVLNFNVIFEVRWIIAPPPMGPLTAPALIVLGFYLGLLSKVIEFKFPTAQDWFLKIRWRCLHGLAISWLYLLSKSNRSLYPWGI